MKLTFKEINLLVDHIYSYTTPESENYIREEDIKEQKEGLKRMRKWYSDTFSFHAGSFTLTDDWHVEVSATGNLKKEQYKFFRILLSYSRTSYRIPLHIYIRPMESPFLAGKKTRTEHKFARKRHLGHREFQNSIVITPVSCLKESERELNKAELILQIGIYLWREGILNEQAQLALVGCFIDYLKRAFLGFWKKYEELKLNNERKTVKSHYEFIKSAFLKILRFYNVPAGSNTFRNYIGSLFQNYLREKRMPHISDIPRSTFYYWKKRLEKEEGRKLFNEYIEQWIKRQRAGSSRVIQKWGDLTRQLAKKNGISVDAARMQLRRQAEKKAKEEGIPVEDVISDWREKLLQPEKSDMESNELIKEEEQEEAYWIKKSDENIVSKYIEEGLTIKRDLS